MPETVAARSSRVFYGWWITFAAFLNLFFTVGIVYYGFPVFYPAVAESLGFTRAQVMKGFFIGFIIVAPLFGLLAGAMIDRLGPRKVIRIGIAFVGFSLIFLGTVQTLGVYYLLCILQVVGYVLAGPNPNQVLVSNWFRRMRGRAMGVAYFGLGLGGVTSTFLVPWLIETFGWRRAFEVVGAMILLVLFPIAQWVTRSYPREMGMEPDGAPENPETAGRPLAGMPYGAAVRTRNFWLLLAGTSFMLLTIGTVIEHLIFFLTDHGYTRIEASRVLRALLISSLAGRIVMGYFADRFSKKNVMAFSYLLLALSVPLLFLPGQPPAVWGFALVFGFAMGADYMLIPLVTAECFGLASLGKLLATIIMVYSVGQFLGPVLAGSIYDSLRSYDLAWTVVTATGVLGAFAVYGISTPRES
jgi:MFS family permease